MGHRNNAAITTIILTRQGEGATSVIHFLRLAAVLVCPSCTLAPSRIQITAKTNMWKHRQAMRLNSSLVLSHEDLASFWSRTITIGRSALHRLVLSYLSYRTTSSLEHRLHNMMIINATEKNQNQTASILCHDSTSYRNPFNNLTCSEHKPTCNTWGQILRQDQFYDLLDSCPVTCNSCVWDYFCLLVFVSRFCFQSNLFVSSTLTTSTD